MAPFITGLLRGRQIVFGITIALIYCLVAEFREYQFGGGQDKDNNVIKALNSLSLGSLGAPVRISFQLERRDIEDEAVSDSVQEKIEGDAYHYLRCQGTRGRIDRTDRLPPSLGAEGVLNFSTAISTDLKILVMGDSVGGQFARVLYESAGVSFEGQRHLKHPACATKKALLHYRTKRSANQDGMTIAAPIRGGGVMAFWRISAFLSLAGRSTKAPGFFEKGGRWNRDQPSLLMNQSYSAPASGSNTSCNYNTLENNNQEKKVGLFDVVIIRVPHGWMMAGEITRSALLEGIHLCRRYLAVDTVIVQTVPFTNNVRNPSDWKFINSINDMIHEVAYNVTAGVTDHPRLMPTYVLVQEFANFTNQMIYENARHIGFDLPPPTSSNHNLFSVHGWEQQNTDYLFEKIPRPRFALSISNLCDSRPVAPSNNTSNDHFPCQKNLISTDGMHWCYRTLAAKFSASIACLLGCVYNGNLVRFYHDVVDFPQTQTLEKIQQCQQSCNDQFMSIATVNKDWLDTDVALFSHS